MKPKQSGLFITFEGGEGAGKSLLIQNIQHELSQRGLPVVLTREPGGSVLGESIRRTLLNHEKNMSIGLKAELLLFLAARAQNLEECIIPELTAGKIVLCDRFNDSTVAYQGLARGLGMEEVQKLCDWVCGKTIPNLTFVLDVDPQIGLQRTKTAHKENAHAGEVDRIESEKLEFHNIVRKALKQLAKQHPDRIIVLDASLTADEVFTAALEHLDKHLNSTKQTKKFIPQRTLR
jgi:dTMP kinase